MKKMSPLLALSISTAVFCGIWAAFATFTGLCGWAGFAGCTTYFSTGKHGKEGLLKTVCTNMAGVLCGLAIFALTNFVPVFGEWGIWCAIITFVMCIISRFDIVSFCPGIFMGCFCTFAANGDWKILIPSLLIGAALGVACDFGGVWLRSRAAGKK